MSVWCLVLCERKKKKTQKERSRITSNIQFSPVGSTFINASALSKGAWRTGKLTMKHMHTQPQRQHTRTRAHGRRLMLCSSVSLLPSPLLHKSQQECSRWKEKDAYIKANMETKDLCDTNIPWHEHKIYSKIFSIICEVKLEISIQKSASIKLLSLLIKKVLQSTKNWEPYTQTPQNGGATQLQA